MLSNTCLFKSDLVTFWPGNPPNVESKSYGFSAFQIPWIFAGGRGTKLGYDHMKLNAVVRGSFSLRPAL